MLKLLKTICLATLLLAGSCSKKEGCTDSTASNYDPAAQMDNGSCSFVVVTSDTTAVIIIPDTTALVIAPDTTEVVITADTTTNNTVAKIGDYRGGGVVFWVDPADSTKGLVMDFKNLGDFRGPWGCDGIAINGADSMSIGSGAQNTMDITAVCTEVNAAAVLCANSTNGGYNDWFLPSLFELYEMYKNYAIIDDAARSRYGDCFCKKSFWSSTDIETQYEDKYAYTVDFWTGSFFKTNKWTSAYVRAVRAF